MREPDIRTLQTALAALGFYRGEIDGLPGPLTKGAIRAAQRRFGLPTTGRADAQVLRRLGLGSDSTRPANPLTDWLFRLATGVAIHQLKGLSTMSFLSGYKTYIIAAAMLLTGIAGLLGVDVPSFSGQSAGDLVLQAFAFFFLRQGLKSDITKS
jgi:peptidoglycan hydrolase-like protein with peptidoglycan-binding domain